MAQHWALTLWLDYIGFVDALFRSFVKQTLIRLDQNLYSMAMSLDTYTSDALSALQVLGEVIGFLVSWSLKLLFGIFGAVLWIFLLPSRIADLVLDLKAMMMQWASAPFKAFGSISLSVTGYILKLTLRGTVSALRVFTSLLLSIMGYLLGLMLHGTVSALRILTSLLLFAMYTLSIAIHVTGAILGASSSLLLSVIVLIWTLLPLLIFCGLICIILGCSSRGKPDPDFRGTDEYSKAIQRDWEHHLRAWAVRTDSWGDFARGQLRKEEELTRRQAQREQDRLADEARTQQARDKAKAEQERLRRQAEAQADQARRRAEINRKLAQGQADERIYQRWKQACDASFKDFKAKIPKPPTWSSHQHQVGCRPIEGLEACTCDISRLLSTGNDFEERRKFEKKRWHPDKPCFIRRPGGPPLWVAEIFKAVQNAEVWKG